MTHIKARPLPTLLILLPLTQACLAESICEYSPPKANAPTENLGENLSGLFRQGGCEPVDLAFDRRSDGAFLAVAKLRKQGGGKCSAVNDETIEISSSRGKVSRVQEHKNGFYSALVTPDRKKTGEYVVTVAVGGKKGKFRKSRTALVFDEVHERWGQPQSVEGLVNTPGWEDSAFITPDGKYLFTMYLPVSPSCLMEKGKKKDPTCHRVQGEVTEENRPKFASQFAMGRVRKDGKIENQCAGVGSIYTQELFKRYDVYVPPMMTYGFHRQPDGSFGNPFPVTVEGVSACTAPSGLEIQPLGDGKYVALMGLVDPSSWNTDQESDYPSLFTAYIKPGQTNVLATWQPDKKRFNTEASDLKILFGGPLKNRQDNPHGVINPKTNRIEAIFWDAEHVDEDIFYRLLEPGGKFPEGPWGPVKKTPVFSDPKQTEIQPFFDGKVLTVHKRYEIASHDFHGKSFADIADPGAWGPERTELAVCSKHNGSETQVLHAVGEPTYADINGKKALYFVYLVRRENGLLDMNVGFVEEK